MKIASSPITNPGRFVAQNVNRQGLVPLLPSLRTTNGSVISAEVISVVRIEAVVVSGSSLAKQVEGDTHRAGYGIHERLAETTLSNEAGTIT